MKGKLFEVAVILVAWTFVVLFERFVLPESAPFWVLYVANAVILFAWGDERSRKERYERHREHIYSLIDTTRDWEVKAHEDEPDAQIYAAALESHRRLLPYWIKRYRTEMMNDPEVQRRT